MGKAVSAIRSQKEMVTRALKFVEKVMKICDERSLKLVNVYVIGSRARGDYLDISDIDLVLIIEGVEDLDQVERKTLFKDVIEGGVDFIILSPKEWLKDSVIIKNLRSEAIPLQQLVDILKNLSSSIYNP